MSHTPGPWTVNPMKALVDSPQRYDDGSPVAICKMLWPTDARTEAETRANADLIAAAPDMLAACKAANAALVRMAEAGQMTPEDFAAVQQATSAAISKAKGGAR